MLEQRAGQTASTCFEVVAAFQAPKHRLHSSFEVRHRPVSQEEAVSTYNVKSCGMPLLFAYNNEKLCPHYLGLKMLSSPYPLVTRKVSWLYSVIL